MRLKPNGDGRVSGAEQAASWVTVDGQSSRTKTTIDATTAIDTLLITWRDSGKMQLARSPFQELANAVTGGTPNLHAMNQ